ncbi:hypothetical protein [Nocardia yamanashiensis]|uniref:hypothetical protein n=1 Tax=Nocardia yamanashiensis TaxID=209247 RepID=UPI000835A02E|nr:hypothetical protein [Nocardia yamanashiensis]
MTTETPGPDHQARHLLAVHQHEAELLAQLAGVDTVRIVGTGGGCMAIKVEAGPLMDPTGTLYLLVTSADNDLARSRDEITEWTVGIFDNPECSGEALSYSDRHANLAAAYNQAWHMLSVQRRPARPQADNWVDRARRWAASRVRRRPVIGPIPPQ